MQRFVLAVIVALLGFSASGAAGLLVVEPCSGYEVAGQEDGTCPPTCVTCGCCARAVEPVSLVVAGTPDLIASDVTTPQLHQPLTVAADILHVPRRVRA